MMLAAYTSPEAALVDLSADFFDGHGGPLCGEIVEPEQLQRPARELLDHAGHMTVVLARRWGEAPAVQVLAERFEGSVYRRRILLRLPRAGRVVETGLIRLDLTCVSDAVKSEILSRRTPLGDILLRHKVLTRVEPRWFLRFPAGFPQWEGLPEFAAAPAYGRIGTIHLDGRPALNLLEVVPVGETIEH